jgi:hypothetical protein
MYMHQCVYQLLIHGGVLKVVQLCYTSFAMSNAKHMMVLIKFLGLRRPPLAAWWAHCRACIGPTFIALVENETYHGLPFAAHMAYFASLCWA